MAKLGLIETIQTKLSTLSKTDGQLIVVRDNASLYVDLNGSRIYISDWVDVSTDAERLAMLSPLSNKYYYVVETNKIWRYVSGSWVLVTSLDECKYNPISLTQAQYDALSEEEQNNGTYIITDSDVNGDASSTGYDNSTSGLNSTNVQGAIDEVNADLAAFKASPLTPNTTIATDIDTLYWYSEILVTDNTTEGTFPEGFDKRGIIEVVIRSTNRVFHRYTDINGNSAVRCSTSSGVWSDWDITATKADVDAILAGNQSLKPLYMTEDTGYEDCNELPIGSMAYTYPTTLNAPNAIGGWRIFTYGTHMNWRTQIATDYYHQMAFRTFYNGETWSDWTFVGKQADVDAINTKLTNTVLPKSTFSIFKNTGWYRVARLVCSDVTIAKGAGQQGLDVQIVRGYNAHLPEMHRITITTPYGSAFKFINEISSAERLMFTKIRYTVDENTNIAYIEVYYGTDMDNAVSITISNTLIGYSNELQWNVMDVTQTEETIEGVTVMGEHEFSANKSYESEIDELALNLCINRKSLSDIDAFDNPFTVCLTKANTAGTFPDGSSKIGMVRITQRTSQYIIQEYMDISTYRTYLRVTIPNSDNTLRWSNWATGALLSDVTPLQTSVSKLKYEWTATIKCATWSRLCYVGRPTKYVTSYLLHIGITRNNVIHNDTFVVSAVGATFGSIVKICGDNYTHNVSGYSVRLVLDLAGNGYFEIYDAAENGDTTDNTQIVYCSLIPISTGDIDTSIAGTDGTTIPENFTVTDEMLVTKIDFQSDVTDAINSKLAYKNISSSIDVGDTGCTASGYVENGNVQLQIIIPAATVSGEKKLYIDTQYVPRLIAGGQIIPITTDYGKIHTCYVSTNGEIYIYTNATLTDEAKVTFTYPLKTS